MSAYEGELAAMPLPLVLQRIAGREETGILTIQGDNDIVAVSFLRGEIVSADALNQTVEEGLGQVLTARGLIDREQFATAAADYQGSGGTLGDLLVDRGLLSREQVLSALREQTSQLLMQLLEWANGEFKFYSGDEVSHEDGMAPIKVEEILVGTIDDGEVSVGSEPVASLDLVYAAQSAAQPVAVVSAEEQLVGGDPEHVEADTLWLSADEMRVWRNADGIHTARTVTAGMDPTKVRYALHRLRQLGLIEPVATVSATSQQVGAIEIFRPPDPTHPSQKPVRTDVQHAWVRWSGRALALLAATVLGVVLWSRPTALLLPVPWQRAQRDVFERQLRQSLYRQIDRAARTEYLMDNRYPVSLIDLVDNRLLPARALRGSSGTALIFSSDENGYTLTPKGRAAAVAGEHVVTVSSDDFLLEPGVEKDSSLVAPLYLID